MEEILRVLPNETEDECLFRIGEAKRDGLLDLTWTQIADFFNKTFRENDTSIKFLLYPEPIWQRKVVTLQRDSKMESRCIVLL